MHHPSEGDLRFRGDFESGRFDGRLGHREHLWLAYVYLAECKIEEAFARVKVAIRGFLKVKGLGEEIYHETMTWAWLVLVRAAMDGTAESRSADGFLELNPELLDSSLLKRYFSEGRLGSDEARGRVVEPDLVALPVIRR